MDGFGLNLRWVTEPPIVTHTGVQFGLRAKVMLKNMDGWSKVDVPVEGGKMPDTLDFASNIDKRDWEFVKRTQQERWNLRIKATLELIDGMCGIESDTKGQLYVEYPVSGAPIGLMVMAGADSMGRCTINLLVTHPGSDNAGGVMIEFAVNQSVKWGCGGKLSLSPNDEECAKAYEALGFEHDGTMCLDPNKSEKWVKVGNAWKLKSQLGKLYRA